jgi:Zn-dependent alcohol dehydrogenase
MIGEIEMQNIYANLKNYYKGRETQSDRDIPLYVYLSLNGRLKLENLIIHGYSLDEINTRIEDLKSGMVGDGLVESGYFDNNSSECITKNF